MDKKKRIFFAFVLVFIFLLYTINMKLLSVVNLNQNYYIYNYRGEIIVHKIKVPNETEENEIIEKELPSFPLNYIIEFNQQKYTFNETCAHYPSLTDIKFVNNYWQTFLNQNVTFEIFGAYYDTREHHKNISTVRILAMVDQYKNEFPQSYCQLWFDTQTQPIIVEATNFREIWLWGGNKALPNYFYPVLFDCPLPFNITKLVPKTVSMVNNFCDKATNNLKVIFNDLKPNETKQDFAVCVKGLDSIYRDISARLVEWLELLRILGVKKVITYELQVEQNTQMLLDYYEKIDGFLEIEHITFARGVPSLPHFVHKILIKDNDNKFLNEIIDYNDCFYKNMYKYNFIALLDIDEIIIPQGNLTDWSDIIKENLEHNISEANSFCAKNMYYPEYPEKPLYSVNIPQNLYMLQHVRRVHKSLNMGFAAKCLHNTNYILTLHNHFPVHQLENSYHVVMNDSIALLQHYREPQYNKTNDEPILDTNIWRFAENLTKQSLKVLDQLKLY